jgi:hypothetical protein
MWGIKSVEMEFHKEKEVIDAWKEYWKHLGTTVPTNQNEQQKVFPGSGSAAHKTSSCSTSAELQNRTARTRSTSGRMRFGSGWDRCSKKRPKA